MKRSIWARELKTLSPGWRPTNRICFADFLVPTDKYMLRITFDDVLDIDSAKLTLHSDQAAAFLSLEDLPGQNAAAADRSISSLRGMFMLRHIGREGSPHVVYQLEAFPEKGDNVLSSLIADLVVGSYLAAKSAGLTRNLS
eukprot:496266-Hanusia_phi.AAC.1